MHIPLIELESVDSTSNYAKLLINEGKNCPFAVCAKIQNNGRGRTGSSWQSPEGNIYLSITMNLNKFLPCELNKMPLYAAALVAQWIETLFHFRVSIKWPNDIYFQDKKLAGILCQSNVCGEAIKELIIGIGLNVYKTPELKTSPYQSTSLYQIVHTELSVSSLTKNLVDFWTRNFDPHTNLVNGNFQRYFHSKGFMWGKKLGDQWLPLLNEGIDEQGRLKLKEIENYDDVDHPCLSISNIESNLFVPYYSMCNFPVVIASKKRNRIIFSIYIQNEKLPLKQICMEHYLGESLSNILQMISKLLWGEKSKKKPWAIYCEDEDLKVDLRNTAVSGSEFIFIQLVKKTRFLKIGKIKEKNFSIKEISIMEAWLDSQSAPSRINNKVFALLISVEDKKVNMFMVSSDGQYFGCDEGVFPFIDGSFILEASSFEDIENIRIILANLEDINSDQSKYKWVSALLNSIDQLREKRDEIVQEVYFHEINAKLTYDDNLELFGYKLMALS